MLERRGREAVAACNAFKAEGYLTAAKTWFDRARHPDRAAEMQALLASAWENHADAAPEAAIRHAFYEDAIRAYRTVSGDYRVSLGIEAALQKVRRKYGQAGRDAVGEMVLFQGPEINLTPPLPSKPSSMFAKPNRLPHCSLSARCTGCHRSRNTCMRPHSIWKVRS